MSSCFFFPFSTLTTLVSLGLFQFCWLGLTSRSSAPSIVPPSIFPVAASPYPSHLLFVLLRCPFLPLSHFALRRGLIFTLEVSKIHLCTSWILFFPAFHLSSAVYLNGAVLHCRLRHPRFHLFTFTVFSRESWDLNYSSAHCDTEVTELNKGCLLPAPGSHRFG